MGEALIVRRGNSGGGGSGDFELIADISGEKLYEVAINLPYPINEYRAFKVVMSRVSRHTGNTSGYVSFYMRIWDGVNTTISTVMNTLHSTQTSNKTMSGENVYAVIPYVGDKNSEYCSVIRTGTSGLATSNYTNNFVGLNNIIYLRQDKSDYAVDSTMTYTLYGLR